jgi:hypothetical protein
MLSNDACSVYPARPLNCRRLLSLSAEACRSALIEGEGEVPYVHVAADKGTLIKALLLGAVRSLGLSDHSYELTGAVDVALADPSTEQSWLAGQNVFAGISVSPRPKATQDAIEYFGRMIAARAMH